MTPSSPPIGFAPPPITEELVEAVARVLRSGWITSGPELAAFEAELAEYLGVSEVVCLSSWTTACELALRWWGVGPGDEVIVPAVTYAATANIVLHCGATPVIVDIDPAEAVLTPASIAQAMTERTKVVMPVDLAGWPVDYDGILAVLESHRDAFQPATDRQRVLGRPLFIADAAHSFGASYKGKPVAAQADVTGYSFHAVKNLTTAEGGGLALSLPDPLSNIELHKWLKTMSLHAATKDAFTKTLGNSPHYDIIDAGYKCNMTDIQAAMGRVQLRHYPETLARRKSLARQYHNAFQHEPWYMPPPLQSDDRESAYHLFMLRVRGLTATGRDAVMTAMRDQGIATNVHFPPLPMLHVHRSRNTCPDLDSGAYPGARSHWHQEISLPLHLELSDADVTRIATTATAAIEQVLQEAP